MNIAELVAEKTKGAPDRLALVLGSREVTYLELDTLAAKIGAWLIGQGVKPRDSVLFYSTNSIEFLATYLGTARIGAVFAPAHPSFQREELSYVATNAEPAIAFVSADLANDFERFARTIPELPAKVVVVGESSGRRWTSFDDIVASVGNAAIVDLPADWPVLISYTSGSTSTPKPVLRSHGAELWSARSYAKVFDYRAEDRALIALPLSWVYGLSTTTSALLAAGATVVLLPKFNPVHVLNEIERSKITLFSGSNTMFVKLLEVYREKPSNLSTLRHCYTGAEPINRLVTDEFERLIGSRIWEGYAATEAFPVLATMPEVDSEAPRETCGQLVPGAQIRLVDSDGRPVPEGEIGEAQFTCPGRMLEYYKHPDLTSERLTRDGWVRSGDLLRRDQDGYYFVVGRLNDMIIRGGANIAPPEVEAALIGLDGVVDATVVSIPDQSYGEAVVAFVSTDGTPTNSAKLSAQLRDRLAVYKIPTLFFVDIPLPSGGNGKLNRRAVAALALKLSASESQPV
ncbi:class I adenylate-forming enzyme family protein [Salinibacterium sp. ZJ450]|uniref:class I adenylate-forming enzyme family protein n=1 Tax=Salinibacterium sp. ZJ450 TaxID=2708338 RepID=UPI0014219425|nr:class I adenylate-forming enzyme family protein [Salinibacterium sp. ZJ450]